MMTASSRLKIGIPVLNRGDLLTQLVQSIDVPATVYIIVNRIGEADASVLEAIANFETLPRTDIQIEICEPNGNYGVAGSWNAIISHFSGGCIISNSDIQFHPGVLRSAMEEIATRQSTPLQHLHAATCFYVTADFVERAGWFDENIYPAYCEDQEMALRCEALGVPRCNLRSVPKDKILHLGSQTLRSSDEPRRKFIQEAHRMNREYLVQKWGPLPPPGQKPLLGSPFGDPKLEGWDWELDLARRQRIATVCFEMTAHECPILYCQKSGSNRLAPVDVSSPG